MRSFVAFKTYSILQTLLLLTTFSCSQHIQFSKIFIESGRNIGNRVRKEVIQYFSNVQALEVVEIDSITQLKPHQRNGDSLVLSLGNASASLELIPEGELKSLPPVRLYSYHLT